MQIGVDRTIHLNYSFFSSISRVVLEKLFRKFDKHFKSLTVGWKNIHTQVECLINIKDSSESLTIITESFTVRSKRFCAVRFVNSWFSQPFTKRAKWNGSETYGIELNASLQSSL